MCTATNHHHHFPSKANPSHPTNTSSIKFLFRRAEIMWYPFYSKKPYF